jgi:F-type H+-transporting ATPase subunit b
MAEGATQVAADAGSEMVAENLAHAASSETMASTEAHGGAAEHHADPTALGLNATAWVALAMLAVIAIMVWKKVPALIGSALDKKIAAIRAQLDEAAKLRAEAEALKAEYQANLAASLIERRGKMAEDKIAAAERAAIAEVRAKAANAAAAAATKLIAERHDGSADKALVDQTIAGIGTSTRLN